MEPESTAGFTLRALVEMKEREEFHSGEEKTSPRGWRVYVSLDRADAIIEGGGPLTRRIPLSIRQLLPFIDLLYLLHLTSQPNVSAQ